MFKHYITDQEEYYTKNDMYFFCACETNAEYREYLQWIASGNTAEVVDLRE